MPKPDNYVDVAERINLFYDKWPDGRLVTKSVSFVQWPKDGILAVAHAYRTPDDPRPGVGTAMEPMPGPTNFTRDSEVQNAETSAWGRAIVACGIGAKVIASSQEVNARRGGEVKGEEGAAGSEGSGEPSPGPAAASDIQIQHLTEKVAQLRELDADHALVKQMDDIHVQGLPFTSQSATSAIALLQAEIMRLSPELPTSSLTPEAA